MLRTRRGRSWALLVLLAAGFAGGCKKEETVEEESPSPSLGGRLEPGRETVVRLWSKPCNYIYDGVAGQVITLGVTATDPGLDPNVRLLDPLGQEEAFDDDGGTNGGALIAGHTLRQSGTYTVRIETDENRTGEVTALLSLAGDPAGDAAGAGEAIAIPMAPATSDTPPPPPGG